MLGKTRPAIAGTRTLLTMAMAAIPMLLPAPLAAQAAPAPTAAVPVRTIHVGEAVDGVLQPGEPSESRYDDYRLSLNANDIVQIDLESDAFDTYLELRRADQPDPVASNDDRGDSLSSRVVYTAATGGDFVIRATRLFGGDGPYHLAVTRVTPPTLEHLAVGRTAGAFDETSLLLPGTAGPPSRYKLYDFRGVAGQRVQLDLTSTALTPRLELLGSDGSVLFLDSGGRNRRNSRLIFVLPRDGTYTVRAAVPATQSGRFDLDLRQGPATAPVAAIELRRGVPALGRFSFDSPAELVGASQIRYFYRDFLLPVRPGEVLTLDLESLDFDPLLEVGTLSPLGFALARRDDDGGDGLNARLVLRPNREGTLTVRARSVRAQIGCYTLRVTPGEPAPAPAPAAAPAASAPAVAPTQSCPPEPAAAPPRPAARSPVRPPVRP